ncbi:MAG: hypothetical protein IPI76_11730 [Chloracidobacterium sp.]|nr:hypothetical protein [Chloracidobacterium sp.]
MGIRSLAAVRHLLMTGEQPELADALVGSHRYPECSLEIHRRIAIVSARALPNASAV